MTQEDEASADPFLSLASNADAITAAVVLMPIPRSLVQTVSLAYGHAHARVCGHAHARVCKVPVYLLSLLLRLVSRYMVNVVADAVMSSAGVSAVP